MISFTNKSLVRFHDGLAWLTQIAMFLTLGLLVFPSQIVPVIGMGLFVSLFLIFLARPASVWLTLGLTKMKWRELTMVSWVGLRGAVPIILATFPLLAGVPQAEMIFNLVFFIVLTSVLLQGPTLPLVAGLLGVKAPLEAKRLYPLEFVSTEGFKVKNEMVEMLISPDSPVVGKRILELQLPKEALVLLLRRRDEFLVPRGGTVLKAGDTMLVLADNNARAKVHSIIGPPQETEADPASLP